MDEKLPGIERPHLQALPQIGDHMTPVPAAGISVLLWRGECMKCVFRGRTFLS